MRRVRWRGCYGAAQLLLPVPPAVAVVLRGSRKLPPTQPTVGFAPPWWSPVGPGFFVGPPVPTRGSIANRRRRHWESDRPRVAKPSEAFHCFRVYKHQPVLLRPRRLHTESARSAAR